MMLQRPSHDLIRRHRSGRRRAAPRLCLLALVLAAPAVAAQDRQRLQVLEPIRVFQAQGPSIAIDPIACLPLEDNGVVSVRVEREPPAARVRIYFRRVNPGRPDFYYVNARETGPGLHQALLPRPTADGAEPVAAQPSRPGRLGPVELGRRLTPAETPDRMRDLSRAELRAVARVWAGAAGPQYEPVELYAALIDHRYQELARTGATTVAVTDDCPEAEPPVLGEALNLTLGETTPFQGEEPPFHFACTGIVTREYSERLFQDSVCREYFVPFEPRLKRQQLAMVATGSAKFRNVTVFYGTDRRRTGSAEPAQFYLRDRGPLTFGTCEVTIPASHRPGELEAPGIFERPDPEKHVLLLSVTPKPKSAFAAELAARVGADRAREALVFIHGYNVSFEDAARRTAQMAADLKFEGAPVMYSWPSQATLAGYPVDENNVRWSVPHLEEFLDLVVQGSGASKVHLVAHSMGNRVLTETLLRYAALQTPAAAPLFNQIVLVAPDVDADVFRDDIAPRIRPLGGRLTLYASENDKALKVSKGVHGHPRAGDLSSGVVVAAGFETIDASDVDTSLLGEIGLGHSYFAEKPTVINDLKRLLAGMSPADRGLAARTSAGATYWKLAAPAENQ